MESRFRNLEIIDVQVAEILRTKTVAERFAMIDQFWRLGTAPTSSAGWPRSLA
jgi:hypothetical protein